MRRADSLTEKLAWVLLRELDGRVHSLLSVKKDTRRNARLRRLGYQLLRVPNGIVMKDPAAFIEKIRAFLPSPAPSGHPLPEGEGQTSGSVPS